MPQDPYRYFRVEARELLEQLSKGVLDLEKGPAPPLVARLLRVAHTLKGAARVVKQVELANQAHAVEEILAPFRESAIAVPHDRVDALLRLLDTIAGLVAALAPPPDPASEQPRHPPPAEEPLRTVRADVGEMDHLLDGVAEVHARLGPLRQSLATLEQARHLAELLADQLTAPRSRTPAPVDDGRARNGARALAAQLRGLVGGLERTLTAGVDQLDRELRQVRDAAEQLRLVPAGALFTALERTARDAAQALDKRIVFDGQGADVRLDTHVLAGVQGALLQMVRNAVAHGIETASERRAAGKPPEGRVSIAVRRRGRRVIFTGSDDGRGVDIEAVRQAAQRKGLLSTETRALGPEELLRLLLKGGISTSGTVTEVSGRGVGLDVVREAAESLGGDVQVRTDSGAGTTVELTVPLTMASVEVLVVESAGATATLPLDAVRETLRIAPADVARSADGQAVVHAGRAISFVPLSRVLFGKEPPARNGRAWSAVVLHGTHGVAAVGVDRLLGTANVVLRPLPELAPASAVVAGASLDADGSPCLMLDPDALIAEAVRVGAPTVAPAAPPAPVLVIDDSLTTRMLEQSILESAGYDVDVATSGEEGLEKARRRHYALFLVDVEMPGIDGFTFVERVRSDPGLRDTPAILVTSRASPEDRRRGADVGARAYIVKSEFDQGALLEQIRSLVE